MLKLHLCNACLIVILIPYFSGHLHETVHLTLS